MRTLLVFRHNSLQACKSYDVTMLQSSIAPYFDPRRGVLILCSVEWRHCILTAWSRHDDGVSM